MAFIYPLLGKLAQEVVYMNWKTYLVPAGIGGLFGAVVYFAGASIQGVLAGLPFVGPMIAGATVAAFAVGAVTYTAMDALGINKMVGQVVNEVA